MYRTMNVRDRNKVHYYNKTEYQKSIKYYTWDKIYYIIYEIKIFNSLTYIIQQFRNPVKSNT